MALAEISAPQPTVLRSQSLRFVDLLRSFPSQAKLALGTSGVAWAFWRTRASCSMRFWRSLGVALSTLANTPSRSP